MLVQTPAWTAATECILLIKDMFENVRQAQGHVLLAGQKGSQKTVQKT